MILNLIRNNYPFQICIFFLIPLFLWIPAFVSPPELYFPQGSGPIYAFLCKPFLEWKFSAVVIAFLLVLFQGIYFNHILSKNGLGSKTSILSAIIFVTCFSFDPAFHTFSPILFLNILLLIIVNCFFKAYTANNTFDSFFNACCCISLCILIYLPAWPLLFLIPITIIIYRLFVWRIWFFSLLGLLAPCIAIGTYYFLKSQLISKLNDFFNSFPLFPEFIIKNDPISICLTIFGILFLIIISKIAHDINLEHIVSFKKKAQVLFYAFLLMLIISFYDTFLPVNFSYITLFITYSFTNTLCKKWKPVYSYLLLLLFIFIIILSNFQ